MPKFFFIGLFLFFFSSPCFSLSIENVSYGGFMGLESGYIFFAALDTSSVTPALISSDQNQTPLFIGKPVNFPNPFSRLTGTHIGYRLSRDVALGFVLYDTFGNKVYSHDIPAGAVGAAVGYNRFPVTATMTGYLPSGVYFYLFLHAGHVVGRGKMTVLP